MPKGSYLALLAGDLRYFIAKIYIYAMAPNAPLYNGFFLISP